MARIQPLLAALAKIAYRELRSVNAVGTNNFFLFCMLLMMQPQSAFFLLTVLGLLMFFPLSADPMKKIPPDRLALLPLTHAEHIQLRIFSIFLSPAIWLILAILVFGGVRFRFLSFQLLLLMIVANALAFWGERMGERVPRLQLIRMVPRFPGLLGGLIQKNLREMLYTLDPYTALILTVSGTAYRLLSADPNPDAILMITMLVVLALSTYAQRLFALDYLHGWVRYRLLPLRGWQILLAKDIAFFLLLLPLVLPLAALPGIAAGLVVLAIGHQPSIMLPKPQARWRFVAGASITHGLMQSVAMFGAGTITFRYAWWIVFPCFAVYAGSLFVFSYIYDKQR